MDVKGSGKGLAGYVGVDGGGGGVVLEGDGEGFGGCLSGYGCVGGWV